MAIEGTSSEGAESAPDCLVWFSPLMWVRATGSAPSYAGWLAARREWLAAHPGVSLDDLAAEAQRPRRYL